MRKTLQTADVGPGGNSQFVVRLVAETDAKLFYVETVNVRGDVLNMSRHTNELSARTQANHLYEEFKAHNGSWVAVQESWR